MWFDLIFFSLITQIVSLKNTIIKEAPKFCVNCKYFNDEFLYSKCTLFVKEEHEIDYLVNGIKHFSESAYFYCTTARSSHELCGKEGKYFVENK